MFIGTSKQQYMKNNAKKRVSSKIFVSISLYKMTIPAVATTEKVKCPGFFGNSHVSYQRSNQNLNWQQ